MHAPEKDSIGTPYYRLEADGKITQTSRWSNAMKATMRTKLRNRQLNIVLQQVAAAATRKKPTAVLFSPVVLQAKYHELVQAGGKPATDWVVKLGDGCYILYYCVGCDTAPTSANQWYRCCTKLENLDIGGNLGPRRRRTHQRRRGGPH